ncbi:TrbI/VirB10 family protein [Paraburkholderia sp. J8-2]|uniref:TrbI/VirB10 family protein n=1 Tax=Paraburkholderia sp. J8-2 TaxID=2805440 RepID=UPI002AB77F59|nr:TrbI/VirB10 family protein [Paraburkholderia sp. J8-2]
MSEHDEVAVSNPFDSDNPARSRSAAFEPPPSMQSPDHETVEDLTRGKPSRGKALGALAVVVALGGLGYVQFFMPTKHKGPAKETYDQYAAPSADAGQGLVNAAANAGKSYEMKQKAERAAAASAPPGKYDPNASANQAIGTTGGAVGGGQSSDAQQLAAQAKAEREEALKAAKEEAERQAAIDAAPIQATDVSLMKTAQDSAPTAASPMNDLASDLRAQAAKNQDAMSQQLDKVAQLSSAYGGQGGTGSSSSATTTSAGQQDRWLSSVKSDGGEIVRMHDAPAGPIISEGTPVRAILLTGLDTDNPGTISAMVTSDVYDSETGTILLIPKGSKLTGVYNHDVKVGQDRVLMAMTRLIRPDLSWVDLSNATGSEDDGTSGVIGDVNNHFFKIFGSALVIGAATLLLDKTQQTITVNQGLGTTQMGGTIFAQTLQQVVSNLLARNQNIPPTITRDGGTQFIFMLRHDLALTPYRGS